MIISVIRPPAVFDLQNFTPNFVTTGEPLQTNGKTDRRCSRPLFLL